MFQGRGIEAEVISFEGLWEEPPQGISFPGYELILGLLRPLKKAIKNCPSGDNSGKESDLGPLTSLIQVWGFPGGRRRNNTDSPPSNCTRTDY